MEKKNQDNMELNQEELDKVNGGSGYTRSLARGLIKKIKRIRAPEVETKEKKDGGHSGGIRCIPDNLFPSTLPCRQRF